MHADVLCVYPLKGLLCVCVCATANYACACVPTLAELCIAHNMYLGAPPEAMPRGTQRRMSCRKTITLKSKHQRSLISSIAN